MKSIYNENPVYPYSLVFKEEGGVLNSTITLDIEEFNQKLMDFEESQKDFPKQ